MISRPRNRGGFTLLELTLALTLLTLFGLKVSSVISTTTKGTQTDIQQTRIDAQARHVLRRIGFAIMGSHPSSLDPNMPAPLNQSSIRFQVNLGISDGEIVWTQPETVALNEETGQVVWSEESGGAVDRKVVWTSIAAPYLEGELPNGIDDNGNGLIDEKGLAISIQGDAISLKLTLEHHAQDGRVLSSTVETVVSCRNAVEGWRTAE